eukprot:1790622-Pyramimonas_sp.AAC.1
MVATNLGKTNLNVSFDVAPFCVESNWSVRQAGADAAVQCRLGNSHELNFLGKSILPNQRKPFYRKLC